MVLVIISLFKPSKTSMFTEWYITKVTVA